MKIKRLSPLEFDSSRSAMAKFFGRVAYIEIHSVPGYGPATAKDVVCPQSFGLSGKKCKLCEKKGKGFKYFTCGLSLCWDIRRGRWAFYLAPLPVFRDIADKCRQMGVLASAWNKGLGPDVMIQRVDFLSLARLLPETCCVVRHKSEPSFSLEQVIAGLESKSVWTKYDSPEAVPLAGSLRPGSEHGSNGQDASDLRLPRADQPREPLLP